MKFLLSLVRNNLLQLSQVNQLRYADAKNRAKTIRLYMLVAVILLGLLAYLIYSLKVIYSIAWTVREVITELVVPMTLVCVILDIAIGVFWGSGLLLSETNIDSLLALPIPLPVLVTAKLSVLYLVEVVLTEVLLLPMVVLFGLIAGMGFPFYLGAFGMTLFLPIMPGLLGILIGTLVYRILKSSSIYIVRLKTVGAVLVLFVFTIYMACKFQDLDIISGENRFSASSFTIYVSKYIQNLLFGNYLLGGLYFSIIFLIGSLLFYGLVRIYQNWYSNGTTQDSPNEPIKWEKQTVKQHSPLMALLVRERLRYFSLPVYITNTACGLVFAAAFVVAIVLMKDKINPYIYQLAEYFRIPFEDYDVLSIFAVSILTTMSCTTYASISIEGKQIEIIKSLPITATQFFRVKILHHLSISVPTILVLNTILSVYFRWPFFKTALGYIMPILYSIFIGVLGFILNLILPNFEWENATVIIKQSMAAVLTTLIGAIATCGIEYVLLSFCPTFLYPGSWIACAGILLAIAVMVTWVGKKGTLLYLAI